MKLHLPKTLLAAVLAVCCTPAAWAVANGFTNDYYGYTLFLTADSNNKNADATQVTPGEGADANTYYALDGKIGADFLISADDAALNNNNVNLGTLTMSNGQKATVKVNGWDAGKNFANLTIGTLTVNPAADSADTNGAAALDVQSGQKVTINALNGTLSSVTIAGTLVVGNDATKQNIASTTVQSGGVLDLTCNVPGSADASLAHITALNDDAGITTAANGFIKVKVGTDNNTQELKFNGALNKNFQFANQVTFHGASSGNTVTLGDGISMKADAGMKLVSQSSYVVGSGASLEASEVILGHTTVYAGGHYGKLTSNGGDLKLGSVLFYNDQNGNALNVSGGSLEFTTSDAIRFGVQSGKSMALSSDCVSISIANATLKATTADWTLDADNAAWATVSGVTVDNGNTHAIALKNVTISGNIVNNAKLTLGTGVTIAAETEASISGSDISFSDTITNAGTLKLSTDAVSVSLEALGGLESVGGTSFFSVDGTTANADGSENGFKMQEGGQYYISTGGAYEITDGLKVTVAGESQYALTSDSVGLGFEVTDAVRTNEYFVSSGEVTVGTGAQALARSYEIGSATMKVTEGSIDGGTINFNAADSSLEVSGTAAITGTLTANQGSTSITGGSVATLAATGAEVSVSGGSVTTLNASAGSVAVSGGSVTTMEVSGGTGSISGGTVATLKVSGGTTNITGGTINAVNFANTGNLNFKLAEGQSSTSYTLNSIEYTTRNNYERNVTIDSGVSVNLATLNNSWGMGTLTVNGELSVSESLSMATGGNNSTTNNVITGSGTINTAKLVIANAGTYNVSGVTMNIGSGGIERSNNWGPKLNLGAMTLAASADWTSEHITPYLVATENASTVVNTNGHTIDLKAGVQGTGNLTKTGEGTLKIGTKTNALSGAVEVSGGSLSFYNTEADASTTLDNLTLSGGTLDVTGSLTLNALSLDLSKYSTDQETYTLISAGTLQLGAGVDLATLGGEVNGYTATVSQSDNSVTLSFAEIVAPGGSITTTVLSQGGFADGMLTLNVDGNLTDAAQVFITGISDSIMAEILGLSGLPEDGMVGITLQGAEGGTFTATADEMIGFQGKDGGIYFGEMVGSNWQYQVAYIPEPASATLGLAALMVLAARRRRKA